MRKLRRWWLLLLIVPLALGGAFVLWAESTPSPTSEVLHALETGPELRVASDPWLVFHPQVQTKKAGLIFYPGGRVDPRAYAPMARSIAAEGYLAVIVPMPLNLAVFDWDAADRVMLAYPEISSWVIGGHSLGGAMAARYAYRRADRISGLLLLAAYPAASDDLSAMELPITSVYGTRDGLATPEKIAASSALLPADTRWVAIEGGNHAQFGWYGSQAGDNPAAIEHEDQQNQTINAALELLASVNPDPR